jgi:hypothetical protein
VSYTRRTQQLSAASTLTRWAARTSEGVHPHRHDCPGLDLDGGCLTAARLSSH